MNDFEFVLIMVTGLSLIWLELLYGWKNVIKRITGSYVYNGLRGNSKCNECRGWTPIKILKIWDGMCMHCYSGKLRRDKSHE